VRNITAAGLIILLLPLLAGCPKERGDTPAPRPTKAATKDARPQCPDLEFRDPDERCFAIQTFVESRLGPYDVYLHIDGGNGAYPPHIPVASGGWKHSVVYRTGVKMTVTVTLRYEGAPSKDGFCSITDGNQSTGSIRLKSIRAEGGSPYQAFCRITTNQ
jgi:hypothetical protein